MAKVLESPPVFPLSEFSLAFCNFPSVQFFLASWGFTSRPNIDVIFLTVLINNGVVTVVFIVTVFTI